MTDFDKIIDIDIEKEMKQSYLDYAMSVIVSRALPDVRDGLKPVHRRIIYAMDELNMGPTSQYRKSARLVGDVLGKYHPHGDSSVYGAMVRLAQDFNTRYLLVDGHGNFGSIDGDSAAAMRYTEARMTSLTTQLLRDINKETVDFKLNFDESLKEPVVLPSRFPNLLVNGSSGIAVGMATNIPPHQLGEVIDGTILLIDNEDASLEEIMEHIKGPDFPTGGYIMGREGILDAYRTGRGRVILRAVAEIEESSRGRYRILVTEIPYQVNKSKLIERMVDLIRDKRLEGISDIRDESDRDGMRLVIEIKRDANPNIVLNNLYKHTQLQTTFGVIMLALVDDEPKVLSLKEMLKHYIDHQREIVRRRTVFDLDKAQARAHILEGLKIALDNIDAIIKLIRGSSSDQEAKEGLMKDFKLSDLQAQAILDMRLRRLTGLERDKIDKEYEELIELIKELKSILADRKKLDGIIKDELLEIKEKHNDHRRTRIQRSEGEIDMEDMIEEEDVIITLTHHGYIKRMPEATYKTQRRGGRGITATRTRDDDFVEDLYITSTHDDILFFTNKGRVFAKKSYEIPEASRQARGTAIINLLEIDSDEKVRAIIPIEKDNKKDSLVLATEKGIIKRVNLKEFENIRRTGIIAINLREDDELIGVRKTTDETEIILITENGKAIRFKTQDVREMGRTAMGVIGVKLDEGDKLVALELVEEGKSLMVISEKGYGKRTDLKEYSIQRRGGKGLITSNITKKTGKIVSAKVVDEDDDILMISKNGIVIRIKAKEVSMMGRNTQGVTLMKTKDDQVVSVATYREE